MNRRIAALCVIATAALGLAACSSSGTDTRSASSSSASSKPAPDSSAPAAGGDQTVAEACLAMATPLQEAGTTMADIVSVTDPKSAVTAWNTLIDAFQKVADSVENNEAKTAVTTVVSDLTTMRDTMSKVADGDTAATSDLTAESSDVQTSLTALSSLCTG